MDVDELLARAEIAEVLARYARGVDRREWELVRSCYWPDAYDDHGLYKGDLDGLLRFLPTLAESLVSTSHQLGNQLIVLEASGSGADVETYCTGAYVRKGRDGAERLIMQGLRYLDRLQRRDGRWAIADRRVILDWEHLLASCDQYPVPDAWLRGGVDANDPSSGRLSHPSSGGKS